VKNGKLKTLVKHNCGGVKSFDAFLLTTLIVLLAAGTRIVMPFLPGNQRS